MNPNKVNVKLTFKTFGLTLKQSDILHCSLIQIIRKIHVPEKFTFTSLTKSFKYFITEFQYKITF